MRKLITGASILLAAAMFAPAAAADTSTVGLHAGNIDIDGAGDADFIGLDGGWNHNFSGNWVLQADAQIEQVDVGGGDLGTSYGSVALGTRNDSYSIYGFVGLTDLVVSGTQVGLGGQLYLGSFVVGADYGHAEYDGGGGGDLEIDQFNLNGTWFVTNNVGLTAEVHTGEVELGGPSADTDGYGVGAVWRLSNSPVSLNARWRHGELDGGGGSVESDTWVLGVNLNFGTDTAQEQATQGASWNGARHLFERGLSIF